MKRISKAVEKKDHKIKTSGRAEYIADKKMAGMLQAAFVRSEIPHGRIVKIELPPLPEGYMVVDGRDLYDNHLLVITAEQPVFAMDEVSYIGEAILLIVGPDLALARQLCRETKVTYQELPAVLDKEKANAVAAHYHFAKGNVAAAFAGAAQIVEETFTTGYQEQAYLEPQGMLACWDAGEEKITVYGTMQCPYYVHSSLMHALHLDRRHVRVVQEVTGGGFGGKEDYPSLLACQAAAAAKKAGAPVRIIHDRREDMAVTTKRHPGRIHYAAALDAQHRIIGLKVNICLDAGAFPGVSSVVMQRSLLSAAGVYRIDNLEADGRAVITNTVPNGAFRGFGAPQSIFAIEALMNHLAAKVGMTPLAFRQLHAAKQGDETCTCGRFHQYVPLADMIKKAEELSGYSRKYAAYAQPQSGRYRKGIGLSLFLHGCGFTGSAEKDLLRSKLILHKNADDTVEILASNTDMGQGLKTTFSKIAAEALGLPLEQIIFDNPDTDRVPNSGPTVASRSIMIVGRLIEKAARRLKTEWVSGQEQEVQEIYKDDVLIPWDMEKFHGDAYPAYSWGLNVVEVEVDRLTGMTNLLGVWGVFDVGTVIDYTIMKGQAEGGILQGIGYGSMEKMEIKAGKLSQSSFTDYLIPTAMDTVPNEIAFIDNPYANGPFGAKGAGELTLLGGAPAYVAAVEQAAGRAFHAIPVTPECILAAEVKQAEG